MKMVLIHPYAGSERHGMHHRPYYLAKEWSKLGHQVTIISASYSHLRREQPTVHQTITEEEMEGIHYIWLKTNQYEGNGLKRVWHMLKFALLLIWFSKRISMMVKPGVVIASSPHPFSIFGAKKIARYSGAKLAFEVRDLWPLTLIELGKKHSWHPFIVFMQFAENYAYRVSDYVVSLLPEAHRYMTKHGMAREKFYYLPNGIMEEEWSQEPETLPLETEELLRKLKNDGKFLIGYAGAHGLANSLEHVLEAALLLREESVAFVLIGDGPEKGKLQQIARERGLNNVWFLTPIPKKKIPSFLEQMDALYVGLKHEPVFRYGISMNKLFDYMMAAKPILFSVDAGKDLIAEYECGLSILPENAEAIAYAVREVKSLSEEDRINMGRRGRECVLANHNLPELAKTFAEELEKEAVECRKAMV
jgi:glycosyltransferase involved in cell wall biosynthesis